MAVGLWSGHRPSGHGPRAQNLSIRAKLLITFSGDSSIVGRMSVILVVNLGRYVN